MPLDAVDVNVHPTKAEVRFREQSLMHEIIRRALTDALGRGPAPALVLAPSLPDAGGPRGETLPIPGVLAGGFYPSRWRQPVPTSSAPYAPIAPGSEHEAPGTAPSTQHPAPSTDRVFSPLVPLGQFRDTFIVAVDSEGIAIIDQHVAHERVLFERVMQKLTAGRLESQGLLTPLLLDLSVGAHQALMGRMAELERLGFEVESFGDATVKVTAMPALLTTGDSSTALRALAEDLEGLDRGAHIQDAIQRIAATLACHAAVKANYPLSYEKMTHILAELRETAYSTICPHGRPVMLRLTRREIEKNFERI
jgi:DNA mismatch repair protein MutL